MRAGKQARRILNAAYDKHILNQQELSERMGWSRTTCSKRINNPMSMTLAEAKKLCRLTGMTIENLMEGK